MSYFLSSEKLESNKQIEITGDEARHILFARRIKVTEKIILQDAEYNRFSAEVISFTKKSIVVKVLERVSVPKEPNLKITLFQALISENALDYILQKSTELGVSKIFLFNARNTPAHLREKVGVKLDRWQRILQEAAKQSNRVLIPEVSFLDDAASVLVEAGDLDNVFFLDKNAEKAFINSKAEYQSLGILVGPEGGFTQEELDTFSKLKNISKVKLGPRVLRADTAAISAIAIIQSSFGDLN